MERSFFLVIGAQKAGTTWLHQNLKSHPRIYVPPFKELHYFDSAAGLGTERIRQRRLRVLHRALANQMKKPQTGVQDFRRLDWLARFALVPEQTDEWYRALFQPKAKHRAFGEITPGYALLPDPAIEGVKRFAPQARIAYLLRDPVDRAVSAMKMQLRPAIKEGRALTVEDWTARLLERAPTDDHSRYDLTIPRWEKAFADQLLFLFYDQVGKGDGLLRAFCDHIGVDFEEGRFPRQEERIGYNPAAEVPEQVWEIFSRHYLETLRWLAERFGEIPAAWLARAEQRLS